MTFLLQLLLGLLTVVVLVAVLYILAALILPLIGVQENKTEGPADHRVYLHGNGVHIDLIFPRADLPEKFVNSLPIADRTKYLAFGWGDRGFYLETPTWAELKVSTAIRAMILKSPSVVHLTEHTERKADWRIVALSSQQSDQLFAYLRQAFESGPDHSVILIPGAGYTEKDHFFEGVGNYHATKTCNSWVNAGFRSAGLKAGLWVGHQNGLLQYYPDRVSP